MADTKLSNLTALTAPASGDFMEILDVSDTSMAAAGTNKKITRANLLNIGSDVQGWNADLQALGAFSATGAAMRTASNTWSVRTLTGTANQITVTNPNGVAGDPTFAFATSPTMPSGTTGTTQTAADNSTKLATTAYSDTLAWANYTPTITNFTTGNGSLYGRYVQKGKMVTFQAGFIFGSTSSIGGVISISLPVTSASSPGSANSIAMGTCNLWDNSALTIFDGSVTWVNTTTCSVKAISYDGSSAGVAYAKKAALSSAIPMTWATSDELQIQGAYEAA